MDNRRQVEALRAANRGMARAVCQGAKTAKRYAALGAGMEVDAQGYGREPTAMVRGVLSCLFVCLFVPKASLVEDKQTRAADKARGGCPLPLGRGADHPQRALRRVLQSGLLRGDYG